VRRTLFDPACRQKVIARLRALVPLAPARWGRMDAPRRVAHLTDQMRHALGDVRPAPVRGLLRLPLARWLSIYCIPWPKGRIQGPPDAFVTLPAEWSRDLAALVELVERFGARSPGESWPDHALFGPMSGRDWGFFCHKHFDHHLRQFGH